MSQSAMSIPVASPIQSSFEESNEQLDIETIIKFIKSSESSVVLKLMKACVAEMEKDIKSGSKRTKNVVKTKQGTPHQLRKNNAWVKFTLKHALANGWEAFTAKQVSKDKETGEKTNLVVEMSNSMVHNNAHVYRDSVTLECPNGKQIIHKEAMSLSKFWKTNRDDIYQLFLSEYDESAEVDAGEDEKDDVDENESQVVHVTSVQLTNTKEALKKQKEEEKEALKKQKAAEKEALKKQKEEEKEALKRQKEEEKEALKKKKAEEKAATSPKSLVKAASTVTPSKAATSVPTAPVKAVKAVTAAVAASPAPSKLLSKLNAAKAKEVEEWTCEDDGNVYPWTFNNKKYLRTFKNLVWEEDSNGELGNWAGAYDPVTKTIDSTATEPVFEDE